jgi:hypothetical protein
MLMPRRKLNFRIPLLAALLAAAALCQGCPLAHEGADLTECSNSGQCFAGEYCQKPAGSAKGICKRQEDAAVHDRPRYEPSPQADLPRSDGKADSSTRDGPAGELQPVPDFKQPVH